ncbi:MAG TPA: hypothetical protein VLC09_16810 [Polyangiaceae bacterium]|nr:hypothetical protein [Polyangiaceae bacterium]
MKPFPSLFPARAALIGIVGAVLGAFPAVARASESDRSGDGVYGRFDGDLGLSLGGGIEIDVRDAVPRPMAVATARFYQAVGVYGAFSQSVDSSDRMERVAGVGLVLEPLFLIRWPDDKESNSSTVDLFIDSLGLHVGAFFAEPRGGSFAGASGCEVGLGAGAPLAGSAGGPWLRGRSLLRVGPVDDPTAVFHLWLEWQWFFHSGALGD